MKILLILIPIILFTSPVFSEEQFDPEQWRIEHIKHLEALTAILSEYNTKYIVDRNSYKIDRDKQNQQQLMNRIYRENKWSIKYRSSYMRNKYGFR